MRILVTGGAGFIGSNIVDEYVRDGHDVLVIDDLSTGKEKNINSDATFHKISICDEAIENIFKEFKPDVVNHHAAQMDVRKSVEDPVFDARTNIIGMLNLLENSKRCGVKKVIFASTGGAVYGEQERFPADEKHPTMPLSPYGVSKLAGEKYLYYYKANFGIDYCILRYANIYGPRQDPHGEAGVVAIFIQKMLKGEQPIINGDGKQTRDFVFVKDAADANIKALSFSGSDVFNIGTGIEADVNYIFNELARFAGVHCKEVHVPAKDGEQRRSVIDAARAEKVLGWKPQVPLNEGLKETVEYFKNISCRSSHLT
ncbi:MAG: NAD-dependent epimerase/dehydratase family protein [Deltaproteobacteria bacterium]|nr:NAD-dependent epimerase/dehydratase family protein [Deltaproteobacteria bacterium]